MNNVKIKPVKGHYEVYDLKGNFLMAADTMQELEEEIGE